MNEDIGINLKRIREKMKLTQEQFAKLIGYSLGGYVKIEQGTRGMSNLKIRKVADALGVTPNDIFLPSNLPDRVCTDCE
jgi:transcriptional regulator with XRE-family HTH domain